MIRFLPDSWLDVLMRPLDMISPDANIYVEVAAPDLRLAAALLLALLVLASSARRRSDARPAIQLLGVVLLAMVPWLATTGNGRYFTPFLLLLGPLCVGLMRLLPLSTFLKFSAAGVILLLQAFLVFDVSPWGSWALTSWRQAPYFQVADIPPEPRSYATLTPISFSLIAPQFPAGSRWMNISAAGAGRVQPYAGDWLARAKLLYLLAPALPSQLVDDAQPSAKVVEVFNRLAAGRGVSLVNGARCDFLPSRGLASIAMREDGAEHPEEAGRFGFWACPARYDPAMAVRAREAAKDPAADAVFEAVEKLCPRFFPPGEAQTSRIEDGATRHYGQSDTRVYVMDDGTVLYKFWRSINAVTVGSRADILAGRARLDCRKIRASTWRSGGP
jgi:hypothetical protein